MIVVDSSAAADYVLGLEPEASWVEQHFDAVRWNLHSPHLVDLEVLRAIRRYVLGGALTVDAGRERLEVFTGIRIRRYPHVQLIDRIWDLRDNVTAFDAVYVALAEALDAPLLTTDRSLARAPGPGVAIIAP